MGFQILDIADMRRYSTFSQEHAMRTSIFGKHHVDALAMYREKKLAQRFTQAVSVSHACARISSSLLTNGSPSHPVCLSTTANGAGHAPVRMHVVAAG